MSEAPSDERGQNRKYLVNSLHEDYGDKALQRFILKTAISKHSKHAARSEFIMGESHVRPSVYTHIQSPKVLNGFR